LSVTYQGLYKGAFTEALSTDRLDLSKYVLTFSDEFDYLSVSADRPGTRWTAHTPYGGDFGDAGLRRNARSKLDAGSRLGGNTGREWDFANFRPVTLEVNVGTAPS